MRQYKIIVEKHPDGYVAYPLGIKGVVVGQGDTYEKALLDVKSAIQFHIESFGEDVLNVDPPVTPSTPSPSRNCVSNFFLSLRTIPPLAEERGNLTCESKLS